MGKYQVFLSYKHTAKSGECTTDFSMANELFRELKGTGISVFFSEQSIITLGEAKYKAAIDTALDDVSILVAIGTSRENLDSNWTKYEWDSFYNDILSGRKDGQLISYIDEMSTADLPRTLRQVHTFEKKTSSVKDICTFIRHALQAMAPQVPEAQALRIAPTAELFAAGLTPHDLAVAIAGNDRALYRIPADCSGTVEKWANHIEHFPDFWTFVVDESNRIHGNYSISGLTKAQEEQMKQGTLSDASLDPFTGENMYAPGVHAAYLLNLSVNPSAESAELYRGLWADLIQTVKRFAEKDGVFFSRIYYKAFLPEHEAKVAARGFRYLCNDKDYGKIFVHDMDPNTTLLALDKELAALYQNNLAVHRSAAPPATRAGKDAIAAHMNFCRQIEELFYQPRYCRLKKYFMGGTGVPSLSREHQLGLATAEWLRDILQYASALLPFLPPEQKETFSQLEAHILGSDLIRESEETYHFATEGDAAPAPAFDDNEISVEAIVTFADIWLDIDKLFMSDALMNLKPFFYERRQELPDADNIGLCEGLAIRILAAMHVSEGQLQHLPNAFIVSYYRYKDMICEAAIVNRVFEKYPFLYNELFAGMR